MPNPVFSVLIPTRNRLSLLLDAISTVRKQTFPDWQLVVADNASAEDVGGAIAGLEDDRIVFVRTETSLPVTENWNRAMDAATGSHVVMLGDDDGLVPGYFERCLAVMAALGRPDFLYHGAFHVAFPGVFPNAPHGIVTDVTRFHSVLRGIDAPALLDPARARAAGRAGLAMRALYGFNMQYFLFSRPFLDRMRRYGPVFQGPYPDFYAANLAMLTAERIGVVPEPMTMIGISPKSYGNYHFNDREAAGGAFLNNERALDNAPESLRIRLLPGSLMNTSWLLSVARVAEVLGDTTPPVAIDRYRRLQCHRVLYRLAGEAGGLAQVRALWSLLSGCERLRFAALAPAFIVARVLPKVVARLLVRLMERRDSQYEPLPRQNFTRPDLAGDGIAAVFARLQEARP